MRWLGLGGRTLVLARARTEGDREVHGTRAELLVVSAAGSVEQRWPWGSVLRASWDASSRVLRWEVDAAGGAPVSEWSFVVADGAEALVDLVHERVQASILLVHQVAVPGGAARVVARRGGPGGGDAPVWSVEVDGGVDPDDPVVRALVRDAAAAAAEELGA